MFRDNFIWSPGNYDRMNFTSNRIVLGIGETDNRQRKLFLTLIIIKLVNFKKR